MEKLIHVMRPRIWRRKFALTRKTLFLTTFRQDVLILLVYGIKSREVPVLTSILVVIAFVLYGLLVTHCLRRRDLILTLRLEAFSLFLRNFPQKTHLVTLMEVHTVMRARLVFLFSPTRKGKLRYRRRRRLIPRTSSLRSWLTLHILSLVRLALRMRVRRISKGTLDRLMESHGTLNQRIRVISLVLTLIVRRHPISKRKSWNLFLMATLTLLEMHPLGEVMDSRMPMEKLALIIRLNPLMHQE